MRGRRRAAARVAARRPPGRRARADGRARWLAAFALLAMFAQLCGLTHALLVRHARCEHGELVHVGLAAYVEHADHHGGRAAPAAAAAPERAGPAPSGDRLAARDALRHLDDDHCDAFARCGQPGVPVHRVAEATLLEVLPRAALRSSPEVRPIPLLTLAPKSSPPAA
ncbi:hypothetical protein WMF31_05960 [Sorangium sp. So ce1036]|uniref:hypothetical protein n=1 Tax=Sorangium sp. So ce1036 TaxID=3133328 RepID=UPI003F06A6BA